MFSRLLAATLLLAPLVGASQSPRPSLQTQVDLPSGTEGKSSQAKHHASSQEKREADRAYLNGAREFSHKDFDKAQHLFQQALQLDPENRTYALALLSARDAAVSQLIQSALKARLRGDPDAARTILESARSLDPTNPLVLQYPPQDNIPMGANEQRSSRATDIESPVQFAPFDIQENFHLHDDAREVVRKVFEAFGISTTFDASVLTLTPLRVDMDHVDFVHASRVLRKAGHLLIVPLDSVTALIAADTPETRDALTPFVEETIYLPGRPQQQLLELANLTRSIFELNQVSASSENRAIAVRGPVPVIRQVNQMLGQVASEESEVLLDINIYEVDKTTTRKIGFVPPTSATATDISSSAQKLISDNQTLLNESIASGALTLSGSTYQQELQEVAFLVAAGVSGSSTFTSILGTLGSFDGVPLLGISMSSTSFNMLLSGTDARLLNAVQIRSSNGEEATFRVGSRYPILTAITTSGSSSSVASELAAAGVSSSVISQIVGSSSSSGTSTPEIQFEDIGLTLKVTPKVLLEGDVQLSMDLKLESLGGTGVEGIPILNNRALKSTVTVAAGETTMLTALVTTNEARALDGIPGLDQLPGFQSTDHNSDGTRDELLITVTPHIVRGHPMTVQAQGGMVRTSVAPSLNTARQNFSLPPSSQRP